jgi:hypothetical protein
VATPLTSKYVNAGDFDTGGGSWSTKNDYVELITKGCLVLDADPGLGIYFLKGITTYTSEDNDAKRWMEWASKVQRRAMYDPVTKFAQATKATRTHIQGWLDSHIGQEYVS